LREQLKWLEELQKHDAKIKELTAALDSIPAKINATENDLARVESLLSQERTQLDEAKKYLAEQRSLLGLEGEQLTGAKHKLSQAKNPREATAAQKEIDHTREISHSREGEIKKLVEAVGAKQKILTERTGEVQELRQSIEKDKGSVSAKMAEVKTDLEKLQSERGGITAHLKADVMKRYAVIRNKKGNAVAPVRAGACTACNMNLPPQLYNTLRRGISIESCPYCHRILYAEELLADPAAAADAATTAIS